MIVYTFVFIAEGFFFLCSMLNWSSLYHNAMPVFKIGKITTLNTFTSCE